MYRGKVKPKQVLSLCLISYLIVVLNTYANQYSPGGVDAANHLFQTWFIKEYGLEAWNPYWYTGSPLLDQYPPLTHLLSAVLANFLGVVGGYKTAYALGFMLLPVSFFFFLKGFDLTGFERNFALMFFSFSVIFVHYFQEGVYSALVSFNFVILYFACLKRVMDAGGYKNTLLAALFLSLCALSHALNPVYCVAFSVPFIAAFSRDMVKSLKDMALIIGATVVLCAWFWIPYLVNYKLPQSATTGLAPETILLELGRAFVVSVNYVGIIFMAVFLTLLAYVLLDNMRKRKDQRYTLFVIAIAVMLLVLRFIPLLGLQETKRALFFIPMFLSIFVARGVSGMKCKYALSFMLLVPLVVLFFAYPPVYVDTGGEISQVMDYIKGSPAERVLFLPDRFDLITDNKSHFPVAEDSYSTFLVPYLTGKEVVNGLWSVGSMTVDKSIDYWKMTDMNCQIQKPYAQVLAESSWINKNTFGVRRMCQTRLNASSFCDNARGVSLDLLVVNRFFPEIVDYVNGIGCLEKVREFDNFAVYKVKEKKPYIGFSDSSIAYTYSERPGAVDIDFSVADCRNMSVDVLESYVVHWKAYLDGKEIRVERGPYGFLSSQFSVCSGKHSLSFAYLPQKYGNVYTYVSIASWILLFCGLIFLKRK